MRAVVDPDIPTFLAHAGPLLTAREAENGFLLGACSSRAAREGATGLLPVRIEADGETVAAGVQVPGFHFVCTVGADEAIDAMADIVLEAGIRPSGISAPSDAAARFASAWASRSGIKATLAYEQRLLELTRVVPPRPAPGHLRMATLTDLDLVTEWLLGFHAEATLLDRRDPAAQRAGATRRIDAGELFLWERDGVPVSMAGLAGPTPHGIRINAVYTPPELRGGGLASNIVASLSQHALDGGRRFTFLYADLFNPATNRIYASIGYEWVSDARVYLFGEA